MYTNGLSTLLDRNRRWVRKEKSRHDIGFPGVVLVRSDSLYVRLRTTGSIEVFPLKNLRRPSSTVMIGIQSEGQITLKSTW